MSLLLLFNRGGVATTEPRAPPDVIDFPWRPFRPLPLPRIFDAPLPTGGLQIGGAADTELWTQPARVFEPADSAPGGLRLGGAAATFHYDHGRALRLDEDFFLGLEL